MGACETTRGLSRRTFVGGTALTAAMAGACLAAPALADEAAGEGGAWDLEADVVVVGSGAAGHAAALEAAAAGASVVMLEKMDITGGDSMLCDGILGGWGTRLAKECGVELTADEIYELFMANPDWYGPHDPAVARVAADKCGETVDWLEGLGVPFEPEVAPRFNYTDLPAIHQVEGKGAQMMVTLGEAVAQAGVDVRTATPAVALVEEEGRAVGVVALQDDGSELRIKANGGVVLATGGYGASYDMLVALDPENANIMPTSAPGMTGDGLVMAQQVGAHVTRTGYQPMMYVIGSLGTATSLTVDYLYRVHGILLDANGDRFCNEGMEFLSRDVARAILRKQNEQGSPVVYLIPTSEASAQLTDAEGFDWPAFETAGEAAASLGLDAAHVEETAARYNGFVEAGADEDFGRPADDMVPLAGPFYAVPAMVITNVTTGGVKTDAEARVLRLRTPREEGDMLVPVPGLYAAGEVCEWNVAAGWTVCTAATMGRIAGANAAAGK